MISHHQLFFMFFNIPANRICTTAQLITSVNSILEECVATLTQNCIKWNIKHKPKLQLFSGWICILKRFFCECKTGFSVSNTSTSVQTRCDSSRMVVLRGVMCTMPQMTLIYLKQFEHRKSSTPNIGGFLVICFIM